MQRLIPFLILLILSFAGNCGDYVVNPAHARSSDDGPGTAEHPWRTLGKAAATLGPGDTVHIHGGIYREWVNPLRSGTPDAPITYAAVPGARVVITGMDELNAWRPQGPGIWRLDDWNHRFWIAEGRDFHPDDPRHFDHSRIGRAEQVAVNDRLLQQVFSLEEVAPQTFFVDTENQTLYLGLDEGQNPEDLQIEGGTRGIAFGIHPWQRPEGVNHIQVRGLTLRYASNHAQRGAFSVVGDGWLVEDVLIEHSNGAGLSFRGNGHRFRRVVSRYNGQLGARGEGVGFRMEACRFVGNNTKGYDPGWEAGGVKISDSRAAHILDCDFLDNNGPGLWLDIDNRYALIERCVTADNTGSGIYIEISGWCTVRNNVAVRNGTGSGNEVAGWGSAGIKVAESRGCVVTQNLCAWNRDGISMREGGPRSFRNQRDQETSWWCEDNQFTRNLLVENRGYDFAFWSDNNHFGKHPNHQGPLTEEDLRKRPALDPRKMRLVIDFNHYAPRADGQPLLLWGCPWREKSRGFDGLDGIRRELNLEKNGMLAEPGFRDPPRDLRLKADSLPARQGVGLLDETPLERLPKGDLILTPKPQPTGN